MLWLSGLVLLRRLLRCLLHLIRRHALRILIVLWVTLIRH